MRLLIIGGSSFLGRATAEEALRRGDSVTTFNRGLSDADVDGVEALRGDRTSDADLAQLAGREFDAVVDTCGFVPEVVGRSTAVLRDSGAFYAYVSSMSATTTWPVATTPDNAPGQDCPSDAGPDDGDYGRLKAGCERAVTETFGDRALVVRSGLIIGPHENVGRLPWWLTRIARGGEVLAPGDPDVPMQLVDARDLAAFMLDAALAGTGGTVNATGPAGRSPPRAAGSRMVRPASPARPAGARGRSRLPAAAATRPAPPAPRPRAPDRAGRRRSSPGTGRPSRGAR